MSTDLVQDTAEAARRHHAGLKPFLMRGDTLRRAARHLRTQRVGAAQTLAGPDDDDHDLCFLAEGGVVVTQQIGDEKPESIRTLAPPVSFGSVAFALQQRRTARVVAMRPTTVLRMSPKALASIARDSPTVAVGLLRWACLDVIDWLRSSRLGNDAWSKRHAVRADATRTFASDAHGREGLFVDGGTQDAVMEILAEVPFLDGASLLPLAAALGDQVHLAVVSKDDPIVAHQDRDGSLFLLLEGRASVVGRNGDVLAAFRAGGAAHEALLGEVAFLAQGGRSGTVVAETECVLLEIPRTSVGWMLTKHGALAVALHKALLCTLCWRMGELDQRREDIVTGGHRID